MHIMYVPGGGITDILLAIPDFSIGYVLWIQNKTKTQSTKHKKEEPKESKNKEEEEPKKEETEPTIKK